MEKHSQIGINCESELSKKPKWKKKRSFMQTVNRMSKTKSFCREADFDSGEIEYFTRVLKMTLNFEGSDEEKAVFASNALAQTEGQEVKCASNKLVSRIIESLLPLASHEVLKRYFDVFGEDLRPLCNNMCASHVLQSLVVIAAKQSLEVTEDKDDLTHSEVCREWVLKVSKFLLNNIEEYITETYANHVIRTAMYCLAGVPDMYKLTSNPQHQNSVGNTTTNPSTKGPSKEFKQLLEEFYIRISKWPQFKDFLNDSLQSGYLQSLLRSLHHINSKQFKKLNNKILNECFPFNDESVMSSPVALPVLEVMMELCDISELQKIYERLLADRIAVMSTTRGSNFTVIKLLKHCNNDMLADIVPRMVPILSEIIQNDCNNVLVSLCEACERLKSSQSKFVKGLVKALNCEDNQDKIVPAALCITRLPHPTPPPPQTKLGSMLVQSLLRFKKPIKVVNSLLQYSPEELTELFSSYYGTFIATTFCKSESIKEESRQQLIQKLIGHFSELATSKSGSRSFDDIWDVADDESRAQIVKDLSSSANKIMGSKFGMFVATKVKLDEFCRLGADKWKTQLKSAQTKRKIFSPIIGGKKIKKEK